jgi:hypothetical protein
VGRHAELDCAGGISLRRSRKQLILISAIWAYDDVRRRLQCGAIGRKLQILIVANGRLTFELFGFVRRSSGVGPPIEGSRMPAPKQRHRRVQHAKNCFAPEVKRVRIVGVFLAPNFSKNLIFILYVKRRSNGKVEARCSPTARPRSPCPPDIPKHRGHLAHGLDERASARDKLLFTDCG